MNLLPVPRTLELTEEMVPNRPPRRRLDGSLPAQGYELHIDASGVELVGGDDAGLFYGEATLSQLARLHGGALPAGQVRDHPDLPVRGVMLDVSRDKVPTIATLTALVDRLASLKVNQVQLYSEHTFAYRDHPEVHAAASPYDAAEIRELDAFCRARHVELVPNQNCLGHMNRWLAHDRYRPLAIAPDGFVDPFGIARPPMTIEPDESRLARAGPRTPGGAAPALLQPQGPRRARRGVGAAGEPHRRLLVLGGHTPCAAGARRAGDADVGRHGLGAAGPGRVTPPRA